MYFPSVRHLPTGITAILIRLRDPQTGHYLHLSGQGSTPRFDWSWLGTHAQAQELRRRAQAKGAPFPYIACDRDEDDAKPEVAQLLDLVE